MTAALGAVIDAHHHLWDARVRDYPWMRDVPDLPPTMESSDLSAATAGTAVTATIVVQAATATEETDWLLTLATASDLIVGVVGWVDLENPAVADRLAERAGTPLVGIRHPAQDEADPAWLTRPEVLRGLAAVRAAGLPYDLLVRAPQRAAALEAVDSVPGLSFVIDHAGKPDIAAGEWDGWYDWLSAMASRPHVTCKLSGLVTEASWGSWRQQNVERYVRAALDLFGPERCMFGSDWPVALLAASYGDVLGLADAATAHLPASERASVFAGTASAVYGVKGGA